jgi:predicted nucleic acid-binding protein
LEVDDIIDYLCTIGRHHKLYYLWRPYLKDPKDDTVLELAVAADCGFIVTYNKKDFEGTDQFGIDILTPQEFLKKIGVL